jgi:hypothetical protein
LSRTAPQAVSVTAEHIAEAERLRAVRHGIAPVELAVAQMFPGCPVDVYSNWLHVCGAPDGCLEAGLPPEAEDFLYGFHDGDKPGPIEFTIRLEPAPDDEA